jgi:NADPH:quinone reductase-like Zn-dependent oxidoreductase
LQVFPWTKTAQAQKDMAANKNSGKIVIEVKDE